MYQKTIQAIEGSSPQLPVLNSTRKKNFNNPTNLPDGHKKVYYNRMIGRNGNRIRPCDISKKGSEGNPEME